MMIKQEIRIAQGQQRAQSEEGFKNMAHEKRKSAVSIQDWRAPLQSYSNLQPSVGQD